MRKHGQKLCLSLGLLERQAWRTPKDVFDKLNTVFHFTIDAAARNDNALVPRYWTVEDDAARQDWREEAAFCNPPFSHIGPFLVKARTAKLAVVLVPLNFLTANIYHAYPADMILIPKGRIHFDLAGGVKATKPVLGTCSLVYGQPTQDQISKLDVLAYRR